jgi:uncharacterized protein (DUF1330 family)
MSVFWLGRAQTRDPEGYKRYGELVAKVPSSYPYQVLARGGRYKVLEGPDDFDRFVLLRFGSMEEAVKYYNSPEYQAAAAVRKASAGRCELVLTEAID